MCIVQQNIHADNFAAGDQIRFHPFQSPLTASHAANTNILVRLRFTSYLVIPRFVPQGTL